MEFILWWSLAALISVVYGYARDCYRKQSLFPNFAWSQLKVFLATLALIIGALCLTTYVADKIQGKTAMRLASNLENLKRESFAAELSQKGEDFIVDMNNFPHNKYEPELITPELAVIRLKSKSCKERNFNIRLQYTNEDPNYDLSRNIPIRLLEGEKERNVYIPLFYRADTKMVQLSHPTSFLIPAANKDCFNGIDRVIDRGSVPLWIDFSVPNNVQPNDLKLKFKH